MTRHIPVHVISVREERERALGLGALGVSIKPVSREELEQALHRLGDFISRPKRLLVVDDDPVEREYVMALVGGRDIEVVAAASGEEALAALKNQQFDCVLLDLGFPGMPGRDVMEAMQHDPRLRDLPVIVHTGRDLMGNEELGIRKMVRAIVVKDARSHESLVQQTALYLHRRAADLPKPKKETPEGLAAADPVLAGKKLLVVDDDTRNIFALSAALECHNLHVISAENGKVALEVLGKAPDIQAVLMDIMMPEMDGYATMRAIREMPRFSTLPIIALTARAMKEDRKKCLEAGASDYIPKPVDIEQLLSLLRLWMDNPERGLATAQDDLASHT